MRNPRLNARVIDLVNRRDALKAELDGLRQDAEWLPKALEQLEAQDKLIESQHELIEELVALSWRVIETIDNRNAANESKQVCPVCGQYSDLPLNALVAAHFFGRQL